jgi:hypothetical protein
LKAVLLDAQTAQTYWPQISSFVDAIIERDGGRITTEDVRQNIEDGTYHVWTVLSGRMEAVVLCEIQDYPRKRACIIRGCAGKRAPEWIGLLEHVEVWAKENQCSIIELCGRRGWQKLMPDFQSTGVFMEKIL